MCMENLKFDPLFSPSDDTVISPPLFSIIRLQMARPRPIPSMFMPAVRETLLNYLNRTSISRLLIPLPVSITWTISFYSSVSYEANMRISPFSVNFSAFFVKFIRIYFRRIWSPTSYSGSSLYYSVMFGRINFWSCGRFLETEPVSFSWGFLKVGIS